MNGNLARRRTSSLTLLILCLSASLARAEVRVAKIFSDHMVAARSACADLGMGHAW